jgi:homoserine O-succinyltransferase
MPIVANSDLPTFDRLRQQGHTILTPERAARQDIRGLHVGLLNMMPDAAMEATERQFFRLLGESNPIAQFYLHPFTIDEIQRGEKAAAHVANYYRSFGEIQEEGLDALIITGANVTQPDLSLEPFWGPLTEVMDWAEQHVTSTLYSCLATHAGLQHRYGKARRKLPAKRWGVFEHRVVDHLHPLVMDVNTRFDVPHSRFNQVDREMFLDAGLRILIESETAGVHLAVSPDLLRTVYFQGHPEYDTISLLKEYKREVILYFKGLRDSYPPFPSNYFDLYTRSILDDYRYAAEAAMKSGKALPEFPESIIAYRLDNTWHDTGEAIVGNWMGLIYQVTNADRRISFMEGIDPNNPLGLL